ncbi:MAG: glycosyltransferase family 4 protein [Actinomycetota bacterium]|nr:glycosyltransferase family 4 protein [Actinomycetota bacterium]
MTGAVYQPDAPAPPDPVPHVGRRVICYYTPSVNPSGMGAQLLDLAAAHAPDADVSVMCRPTEGGRRLLDRAAASGALPVPLPGNRDPAFGRVIADHLTARPPAVFHSHVGWGWEDWDGVHLAHRLGVPAVIQSHHLPFLLSHPRKAERLHRAIEPVDHLIAVSAGVRRTYERIGVPAHRFTTVPNGVAPRGPGPGRAAARRALGLSVDQLVVMTAGRLVRMKGQRYLVDAVPDLVGGFPDLAVVILGEGPLRRELADRAADLGVESVVRLAGHRDDARLLLDAADVFVLPSRHEGMPLAALEAMEAGLPVVGTRVIGTDEVVVDGETGLLVPAEDPHALAAAVADLLAHPDLRAAYAGVGRRRYLEHHTVELMAARTRAVYDAVLATHLPASRETVSA